MTGRIDDVRKRDQLSFEELMARSSVGDATDPVLDHACTEEEATAFAAEYSRSQTLLEDLPPTHDKPPSATISGEDSSEIRRVETLRAVWPELANYVLTHVCEDRTLMAKIMHEAAATFTHYWREKGNLDREHALAVLRRATKLHGRQGLYKIDWRRELDAVLLDLD